jgi:hypothetical protein
MKPARKIWITFAVMFAALVALKASHAARIDGNHRGDGTQAAAR